MAGIKGRRPSLWNARLHRRRTESDDLSTKFDQECYQRRTHVVRMPWGLGWRNMVQPRVFTMEEYQVWHRLGFRVPLDLVPREYWWDDKTGFPRFGEEALGKDF